MFLSRGRDFMDLSFLVRALNSTMTSLLTNEATTFLHELLLYRVRMGSPVQSRCRSVRLRVGLLVGVLQWLLISSFRLSALLVGCRSRVGLGDRLALSSKATVLGLKLL